MESQSASIGESEVLNGPILSQLCINCNRRHRQARNCWSCISVVKYDTCPKRKSGRKSCHSKHYSNQMRPTYYGFSLAVLEGGKVRTWKEVREEDSVVGSIFRQ